MIYVENIPGLCYIRMSSFSISALLCDLANPPTHKDFPQVSSNANDVANLIKFV